MGCEDGGNGRPYEPGSKKPIGPFSQPGYYPGFRTLDQQKFWDAKTREVILDRVQNVPPIRFFTADEAKLLEMICAHVIPQDDRDATHKIPIVPWIDKRLNDNRHDGYRFADMPPDGDAFRLGLRAIEEIARHLHRREFTSLDLIQQDMILKSLHDSRPQAGYEVWERMPVHRFWIMLVQDCIEAYYAHPWAWDEIGFGGPAYPRGYIRLENGQPEPWESSERRYEWKASDTSVSDLYEPRPSSIEHSAPHRKRGSA
jgi:hypothetical protein